MTTSIPRPVPLKIKPFPEGRIGSSSRQQGAYANPEHSLRVGFLGFSPATLYLCALFTQGGHQPVFLVPTNPSTFGYNLYAMKPDPSTPNDHPLIMTTFKFNIRLPVECGTGTETLHFKVPLMHIHSPDPKSTPLPPVTLQITLPATVTPKLDLVFVSAPIARLPLIVTSIPQVLHSRSAVIALPPCGSLVRSWRYLHRTLDQLGFRHRQPMFVLGAIKSLNKVKGKSEVNPWDNKPKEDKVEKAQMTNEAFLSTPPPPLLLPAVTRFEATSKSSPASDMSTDKNRWNLLESLHIIPEEGGIGARRGDREDDFDLLDLRGRGCVMIGHIDTSAMHLVWPSVFRKSGTFESNLPMGTQLAFSNECKEPELQLLYFPEALTNETQQNESEQYWKVNNNKPGIMKWRPPQMILGEIDGMQSQRLNELHSIFSAFTLATNGQTSPYPQADRPRTNYSNSHKQESDSETIWLKGVRIRCPRNAREALAKENALISAMHVFIEYWTNTQKLQGNHQISFVELISTNSNARLIFISILLEIANAYASINSPELLEFFAHHAGISRLESKVSASDLSSVNNGLLDSVMDKTALTAPALNHAQPPQRWGGYFWLVEILQRVQSGEFRNIDLSLSESMSNGTTRLLPNEQLLTPPSAILLPSAVDILLDAAKNGNDSVISGFTNCSRVCACSCYEHLKIPLQLARFGSQPHHFLLAAVSAHEGTCISRAALTIHEKSSLGKDSKL